MSFASIILFYRVISFLPLIPGGAGKKKDSKAMEIHFFFLFSIIYFNKSTTNINSVPEIVPNSFRMQLYLLFKMMYGICLCACIYTVLHFLKKIVGPLSPFLLPLQKYMEVVGKGRLSNLMLTRHYICAFFSQLYVTFPDAENYKRQSYQCLFKWP